MNTANTAPAPTTATTHTAHLEQVLQQAREAQETVANAPHRQRNDALRAIAQAILESRHDILEANEKDMQLAEQSQLAAPLLDRLRLTDKRISSMADGIIEIADQPDLVGKTTPFQQQASGIGVATMRVPIGIIAIIYESRPNVTADAAALCLKAGNVCILHGGKEATHSNQIITDTIKAGLKQSGLPVAAVQQLMDRSGNASRSRHETVADLLGAEGRVDLAIPRGGNQLARVVTECARVPVLKHLDGICHMYVHKQANLDMATELCVNAKCHRCSVCCATETILIDHDIAPDMMMRLGKAFAEEGVEIRGCAEARLLQPQIQPASEEDWRAEYLAPIVSIRIVKDLQQAIDHISHYGSQHTDSIVTQDQTAADTFIRRVDSSSVMHNAPTVFADGKEYGLGAEIGISTDKLHARGPIGVAGLTCEKFVIAGNGKTRH
ncbi:MAG: glutamate-5-semialdehyde dehydrogenase [Gammaproteobacteria bacterium]